MKNSSALRFEIAFRGRASRLFFGPRSFRETDYDYSVGFRLPARRAPRSLSARCTITRRTGRSRVEQFRTTTTDHNDVDARALIIIIIIIIITGDRVRYVHNPTARMICTRSLSCRDDRETTPNYRRQCSTRALRCVYIRARTRTNGARRLT